MRIEKKQRTKRTYIPRGGLGVGDQWQKKQEALIKTNRHTFVKKKASGEGTKSTIGTKKQAFSSKRKLQKKQGRKKTRPKKKKKESQRAVAHGCSKKKKNKQKTAATSAVLK